MMSDMDSTHDQDEPPVMQLPGESVEHDEHTLHALAHSHDHHDLVSDVVLDTDTPEVVLSKKALENEGGALESAYVVDETELSEAEFAEPALMDSPIPTTLPEIPYEVIEANDLPVMAVNEINSVPGETVDPNHPGKYGEEGEYGETGEGANPNETSESTGRGHSGEGVSKPSNAIRMNEWRLEELTRAVERYPNTPTNYVLRGEVYLALNKHALATVDFNRAIDLAEARLDELPWGYANAAFIDRAHDGLRRVRS